MKSFLNFMKGKKDDKKEKLTNSHISVEITNPSGQKVQSEDEHIEGLQSGYGYDIDLNGKDRFMSKLHKAAWQGNLDKIKVYAKKVDVNLVDEYNRTPLHLASAQGHTNVVWYLLSNKASMDVYDGEGMTPFLKAVECGVKECVHLLIERGVDLNTTDGNGNTGLHLAARQGFFNIMSLLLKKGANYDSSNNMGEMPLHIATEQEHKDLVELLLQYGAHVNVVDRDNRTPLMLAARSGQSALVSLFLEYGAHLDTCDSNGWTAEDYALIGGHTQFAAELKVPVTEIHIEEDSIAKDSITSVSLEVIPEHVSNGSENATDEINNERQTGDGNDGLDFKSPPNSILVVDEEAQDSPRSCITPPPLKPPRSWEMIQAGMIDNSQVRRRSLLALGTLRSHRDSFSDANVTSPHSGTLINNISTEIQIDDMSNLACEDLVDCKQSSDTEWESEDSLPLDRSLPLPPPDIIITPDRRSKITLERTPSLDLTDDDHSDHNIKMETDFLENNKTIKCTEELWISNSTSLNHNINIENGENNNNVNKAIQSYDIHPTSKLIYDTGQVSHTDNRKSVDFVTNEIYKNIIQNENIENESSEFNCHESQTKVRKLCSLDNLDDVSSRYIEIESSYSCDQLDSESLDKLESFSMETLNNTETATKDCDLAQSLDSLEESPFGTVVKRSVFQESHSLELLEDTGNNIQLGKPSRRHARHKSITVNSNWSKSVDVLVKPSNIDKISIDSKKIDAQLQCYDEALRELEQDKLMKIKSSRSLDSGSFLNIKTVKPEPVVSSSKGCNTLVDDSRKLDLSEYRNTKFIQDRGNSKHDETPTVVNFVCKSNDISLVSNLHTTKQETKFTCVSVNIVPPSSDSDSSHQISINGKCSNSLLGTQVQCKRLINCVEPQDVTLHSDNKEKPIKEIKPFCIDVSKSCNSLEKPIISKSDSQSKSDKNINYSNESKNTAQESISSDLTNIGQSRIVKAPKKCETLLVRTTGETSGLGNSNQKTKTHKQKSMRKEKSESEIENKFKLERHSSNIKARAGRSISMYVEQLQIKEELLKNCKKTIQDDFIMSEKSESDSEWNERPLRNKRRQLLAMRGIIADPKDSEDSNEEDPPFWLSTDKGGCFARQDTVVFHPANVSTPQNSPQHEENETEERREDSEVELEEIYKAEGRENTTSGSSSEVSDSASVSQSDTTPHHTYTLRTHQKLLKDHLRQATSEKVKLEELVAQLKDQVERLQYELADTSQHITARDDKIIILQDELSRLGEQYSSALEDVHTLNYKLSLQEVELKYLRDVIQKKSYPEKEITPKDPTNDKLLEYLEEVIQANKHVQAEKEALIAQNMEDIRKLQEDTIHWKELYEEAMSKLEHLEGLRQPHLLENLKDVDSLKFLTKDFQDNHNLDQGHRQNKLTLNTSIGSAVLWDEDKDLISNTREGHASHSDLKLQLSKTPSHVPISDDVNIDPQSKQVILLEQQLEQERNKGASLNDQVNKLMKELQKKLETETELDKLYRKIEEEYVPREQLKQLQSKHSAVIDQIQQVKLDSESKFDSKIREVNQIIEVQLAKQVEKDKERDKTEMEMKQEFEYTRRKLLFELSKVQTALKAKEYEEKILRERCEKLSQDVEKSEELKRRQLIEKSYNVNLIDHSTTREKQLSVKQSVIPPPPPPPPFITSAPESSNPFSATSLRQQLELSIRRHQDSRSEQPKNGNH